MDQKNPLNFLPQNTQELLMNPTVKNIGDTLGGISELLLSPLNIGTIWANAHIRKFKQSIIDNVNKIPEENRDSSKINLAMKTIEDSKYQISDDNLREMFAKLVAASIDKRNNQGLSPRFSNVLSQFSSEDAKFLIQISTNNFDFLPIPTVIFFSRMDDGSGHKYGDHFIAPNNSTALWFQNELSLNNLVSLGIINQSDEQYLTNDDIYTSFYDSAEKSTEFLCWSNSTEFSNTSSKPSIKKGVIEFTTFGKKLIQIVIQN
ncbi:MULTISPECIES: DUF4393 domain-containing protein [Lactobacillus]|uniref:DUF4393 domain-containing protein n=1 Tax=Lactobacillus TaxID=1578 RepID=UPI000D6F118B|nr:MULTISPECIES: DUF4393 domain-containing protein [Lactobacillus]AWN33745.1 hypothetical protein DLD54_06005 [Lactobacillus helsingborgensis]RMC53202.1 DUF4393 domain-containing protein [Lactobacillus sp. ESL0262]